MSGSDLGWRTGFLTGLNRNQVAEMPRLVSCQNLVCEKNEFEFWNDLLSVELDFKNQTNSTQTCSTHLAAASSVGETEAPIDVGHLLRVNAEAVFVFAQLAAPRYERFDAGRRRHRRTFPHHSFLHLSPPPCRLLLRSARPAAVAMQCPSSIAPASYYQPSVSDYCIQS